MIYFTLLFFCSIFHKSFNICMNADTYLMLLYLILFSIYQTWHTLISSTFLMQNLVLYCVYALFFVYWYDYNMQRHIFIFFIHTIWVSKGMLNRVFFLTTLYLPFFCIAFSVCDLKFSFLCTIKIIIKIICMYIVTSVLPTRKKGSFLWKNSWCLCSVIKM